MNPRALPHVPAGTKYRSGHLRAPRKLRLNASNRNTRRKNPSATDLRSGGHPDAPTELELKVSKTSIQISFTLPTRFGIKSFFFRRTRSSKGWSENTSFPLKVPLQ